MSKRKITVGAIILVLLLTGGIWAWMSRPDPEVVRINKMQDEMLAAAEPGKPPSREQFEQMHKEMGKLNENQRRQVMEHGHQNMQRAMNKRLDEYFEASPEEKKQILDEHIQRMENRRKEMEKHRNERPPADRPNAPPQGRAGAGGPPGGPGGPPGHRRRNRSPTAHSEGLNRMLNHVSPERRAKWSAFMTDLMKRRLELGLPAFPGPPHHSGRPPKK